MKKLFTTNDELGFFSEEELICISNLPAFNTCPKLSAIQDIAQHNAASNANASSCPSGGHRSPDAFVMNHCTVTHSSSWIQGLKVHQVY